MTQMTYEINQASGFLYHQPHLPFSDSVGEPSSPAHAVSMGSLWTLHSSLVGASPWLLLWALFSLLFPVFSDVQGTAREKKKLSVERGVVNEKETVTEGRTGLEREGVNGVISSLPQCVKLADNEPLALHSGGDVVIGGVFPLHYVASQPQHSYQSKPQLTPCSG